MRRFHRYFLPAAFLCALAPGASRSPGAEPPQPPPPDPASFAEPFQLTPEFSALIGRQLSDFAWRTEVTRDLASGVAGLDESNKSQRVVDQLLESPLITGYLRWMLTQRKAGFALREKDFSRATRVWALYRQQNPEARERADRVLAILRESEGPAQIRNLGPSVNSVIDDYMPVPELSGRRIYFTIRDPKKPEAGEDIFQAVLTPEGAWKRGPIASLNTDNSESPDGVSPDGTRLYLFGNYPGSLGRGDIFYVELTAAGWSSVRPLPAPVNSPFFDSDTFFAADGKAVLFASDRPGGPFPVAIKGNYHAGSWWGNTDLYVSFVKDDGSFSLPRNLGPMVNTPGAERTPFLHPDGRTLYFSSDGYDGLGDMDIYKSVRLDDTWQRWSEPRHIGKIVNGSGTDWGFRLTAASDRGYFSGNLPGSVGGEDIFEVVPLPPAARPADIVAAVRGRVQGTDGAGLQARVECVAENDGAPPGLLQSRPDSGEFYITLPIGKKYHCSATRAGYVSGSQTVDLRGARAFREETVNITLTSLRKAGEENTEIVLNNVLFQQGSDALLKESSAELDRLARILTANPELKIEIQGHSDAVGNDTFNLGLSQKRADAVMAYLAGKGIAAARLRAKGYGETKPIDSNDTPAGRGKNRRVSFIIIK